MSVLEKLVIGFIFSGYKLRCEVKSFIVNSRTTEILEGIHGWQSGTGST